MKAPGATYPGIAVGGGDTATPLNLAKRLRIITAAIPVPAARVLDGGCGVGEYVWALSQLGVDAHGIEYLQEKVAVWNSRNPGNTRVRAGDLAAIDHEDHSFDMVLLNEVLEHVPDERAALREVRRVLRPGGVVLVFSPNRFYPFETHGVRSRRTGTKVPPARTFLLPYVPVSIGRRFVTYWARNYWPWELRALLREAGFTILKTGYVFQTFENISGHQPAFVRAFGSVLRALASVLERTPGLRRFATSQLVLARAG